MSVVGVIDKYEATGSGLGVLPSRAQTGALHEQAGGPGHAGENAHTKE